MTPPQTSASSRGSRLPHRPLETRAVALVAAVPIFFLALLIYVWGVDLPFWDQWILVSLHEALREGTLQFADLWVQHNEHRIFFPRLISLSLGLLTGWNLRWEMAINFLLALGIFRLALLFATGATHGPLRTGSPPVGGRTSTKTKTSTVPAWFPILASLFIFHPNQWENWIWGIQTVTFLNVLAAFGGFAFLAHRKRRPWHLGGAALCGIVASLSFGNGLLFWPLALPLVLRPPGHRLLRGLVWLTISIGMIGLYLYQFQFALDPPLMEGHFHRWTLFLGYLSVFIGAPLFPYQIQGAMVAGLLALLFCAAWMLHLARRKPIQLLDSLPWLTIAAYAVATGGMTAAGRLGMGLEQALSSRYITCTNLFWLGLLGLVLAHTQALHKNLTVVGGVFVLLLLIAVIPGVRSLQKQHEIRQGWVTALRQNTAPPQDLIFPDANFLHSRIPILRRHRLSLFRTETGTSATSDKP